MGKAKKIILTISCVLLVGGIAGGVVGIVKHKKTEQSNPPIPEHTHIEVIDSAVNPTCTATGLTQGKHCSECGAIIVEQQVVPIIDHNYVNGVCAMCDKDNPNATLDTNAFYLVGSMNGWAWSSDRYKFIFVATDIPNITSQYKLTVTLTADTEVKVWKGNDDWGYNNYKSDWEYAVRGENLTITQSGTYAFYLKFYNDGGSSVYV